MQRSPQTSMQVQPLGWNAGAGFQPVRGQLDIFNGLGHVVKGLTINSSASSVGLFKSPTSILNVGIDAASTITSTSTINSAFAPGEMSSAFSNTTAATGALLGYGYDGNAPPRFIYNSFSNASVTAVTGAVGGLVGTYTSGTIDNSASYGNVTVNVRSRRYDWHCCSRWLGGSFCVQRWRNN